MKRNKYLLVITVFGLLATAIIQAQSNDDFINNLIDRIDNYYTSRPHDNIYIHTDRSVYFTGEEILFKAFITQASSLAPSDRSDKCVLALMDARGEEVISNTFDIEKGFSTGSFRLPLNLNQGRYNLLAYVKKDGMITANKVFNKDIIITDPAGQLMLDYKFNKDFYVPSDEFSLDLNAYGYKSRPLSKLQISYEIKSGDEILNSGKGLTDKTGLFRISSGLPESLPKDIIIQVNAKKGSLRQEMFIKIPFAISLAQKPATGLKQGVFIDIKEITESRLRIGTNYSMSGLGGDKKVVIALFRKGLLYWSAPGLLSQAQDISIPITRVPTGILDIVVFDPEGYVLGERMAYLDRESMPALDIELNRDTYHNRQKVEANVSFKGNIINIPENTNLTVSVVPKDMLPVNDLLLNDHMLIDADLQQDSREILLMDEGNASRKSTIQKFLDKSDRNGYSWDVILGNESRSDNTQENTDLLEESGFLYFPSYFTANKMKDYSQGIRDSRHPNAQQANYKRQLESGMSVLEVIKTIKPYTIYGNKIIFPGKVNSLYAQQGALIVIDNQPVGQDATILNSISPTEVESIVVSTNPGDVQRYTALNSVGVIEISMKGYSPGSRIVETSSRDELVRDSYGKYLPGYPDYSLEEDMKSVTLDFRSLLFWQTDLQPGEDNKATFEFYTTDMPGTYVITVQGMLGAYPVAVRKEFVVN